MKYVSFATRYRNISYTLSTVEYHGFPISERCKSYLRGRSHCHSPPEGCRNSRNLLQSRAIPHSRKEIQHVPLSAARSFRLERALFIRFALTRLCWQRHLVMINRAESWMAAMMPSRPVAWPTTNVITGERTLIVEQGTATTSIMGGRSNQRRKRKRRKESRTPNQNKERHSISPSWLILCSSAERLQVRCIPLVIP